MEERERESKRRGRELVVGGEDKRVWSSKQCTIAGLVGLGERWRKRNTSGESSDLCRKGDERGDRSWLIAGCKHN